MAKSHEGWDPELFVVTPGDDDLCNICCQVLDDAVETGCGHSFCEKCIKGWLEQRQVCPQDQKPLSWAECRPMVRDRRRILDMKVKCPWCDIQMELRALIEHKKSKCSKKPEDAEEEEDKEPLVGEKVEEEKGEDPEYIIELAGEDGEQDHKIEEKREEERKEKEMKEAQERDRILAAQLQEQERMRNLSVRPANPRNPSVQQNRPEVQLVRPANVGGEPHVEDFGSPVVEYYQADELGEAAEGQEGQPDKRLRQAKQQSGCCGCSDRCWCCMCCFFWILLLVLGVSIWFWGISGTAAKVGL